MREKQETREERRAWTYEVMWRDGGLGGLGMRTYRGKRLGNTHIVASSDIHCTKYLLSENFRRNNAQGPYLFLTLCSGSNVPFVCKLDAGICLVANTNARHNFSMKRAPEAKNGVNHRHNYLAQDRAE